MKKAIIITGPTATGKTSLALKIAKDVNGALISVDSIQVYKECNIISGKDIPQASKFISKKLTDQTTSFDLGYWDINGVQLYLTDVVDPTYNFSVADFITLSKKVYKKVQQEEKVPIFVGGTTLYVKSLLTPIETAHIPPDLHLRQSLEQASIDELQAILAKYDKTKLSEMNESDINNPRRLVRSIEVAKSSNTTASEKDSTNWYAIGLSLKREELRKKISVRVEERLQSGAIDEVKKLFNNFSSLSPSIKSANGYRQLFEYLNGSLSKEDAIEKWKNSEYLHAKNQMTFFNKMPKLKWVDTATKDYEDKIIKEVKNWLSTQKTALIPTTHVK